MAVSSVKHPCGDCMQLLDDPAFIIDGEGYVRQTNPAACRLLEYEREELIWKHMSLLHADVTPAACRIMLEKVARGDFEYAGMPLLSRTGRRISARTKYSRIQWEGRPAWFALCRPAAPDTVADEKFYKAFHANPAIMAVLTVDGMFVDVNESGLRRMGYTRDEVVGRINVGAMYQDAAQRSILRQELFTKGRIRHWEVKLLDKQGRPHDTLLSAEIIHLDDQPFILALMDDITELMEARQHLQQAYDEMEDRVRRRTAELAEANLRWQFALEGAGDGVWDLNVQTGAVFFSPRAKIMLGYRRDKKIDHLRIWEKLVHPDDLAGVCMELERHYRGETLVYQKEYRIRYRDGSYKWLYSRGKLIEKTSNGEPLRIIGTHTDITERKLAEQALVKANAMNRETSRMFESLLDAIPDVMGIQDAKHGVIRYNQAGYKFLEKTQDQVVGRKCFELLGRDTPCKVCATNDVYRTKKPAHVEKHIEELDVWLDVFAYPVLDDKGNLKMVLEHLRDITERKRMEQVQKEQQEKLMQADKMATLGFLTAGVAHEINNPTQFIMTNMPLIENAWQSVAGLLEDYYRKNDDFLVGRLEFTRAREIIPELFAGVKAGVEHIKGVVAELRDYARAQPDEIYETVDLNAVVRAALTLMGARVEKVTRNFQVNYYRDLPPVRGQFRRLEQVVINLVQNACDALQNSSGSITVNLENGSDQDWIELSVTDTGTGMSVDDHKHVFDPFYTTKRADGGMGLGIPISQAIVLQHGGRMEFHSSPGQGTRVVVSLPVGKGGQ